MKKFQQKLTACLITFLFLTLLSVDSGKAQESEIAKFPSRPITIIVPFSAGGSADLAFRLLGKEAEKFFGQPVVIVNKAGGGGAAGFASVAAAKPDGYTIGHSPANAIFILPFLENLPYHPVRDFKYIMQLVDINFGIIVLQLLIFNLKA